MGESCQVIHGWVARGRREGKSSGFPIPPNATPPPNNAINLVVLNNVQSARSTRDFSHWYGRLRHTKIQDLIARENAAEEIADKREMTYCVYLVRRERMRYVGRR